MFILRRDATNLYWIATSEVTGCTHDQHQQVRPYTFLIKLAAMTGVDAAVAKRSPTSSLVPSPAFVPTFMLRLAERSGTHRRDDRWIAVCERCDRTFDSDRWDGVESGYLYALRCHISECDVAEKQDLVDRGNWAERCRRDFLDALITARGLA